MEFQFVLALFDHWRATPPVHEMLAAFFGVKAPQPSKLADPNDPSGIGDLVRQFPSGFIPA